MRHFTLPVSPATVHWGYFSKKVTPALTLRSGDRATIETLTHHANDDYERMIANDPGAESVFHWTSEHKAVARRGSVCCRVRLLRLGNGASPATGDRARLGQICDRWIFPTASEVGLARGRLRSGSCPDRGARGSHGMGRLRCDRARS